MTDDQILNLALTAADELDATRISEMTATGWKATTIFEGDAGLLRFGRMVEEAVRREYVGDELTIAKAAIKAMAEDGWLFHGVEGMSEPQKLCYEAYMKLGLKDAVDLVYPKNGMKECEACKGAGVLPHISPRQE